MALRTVVMTPRAPQVHHHRHARRTSVQLFQRGYHRKLGLDHCHGNQNRRFVTGCHGGLRDCRRAVTVLRNDLSVWLHPSVTSHQHSARSRSLRARTMKTITILISQDSFVEGVETFVIALSRPTGGAALASPSAATVTINDDATESPVNPIDDAENFVRQHYHDFLNREPDPGGSGVLDQRDNFVWRRSGVH